MDNSPTALFDSYEQDFQQVIASVREKVDGEGANERGGALASSSTAVRSTLTCGMSSEQRKASLRRVEMELDEADELVRALSNVRNKPPVDQPDTARSRKWRSRSRACRSP